MWKTPSDIQVSDEPLELSIAGHLAVWSSMLLKGSLEEEASLQEEVAWLRNATVIHKKRA
jgi:hypothetical protein